VTLSKCVYSPLDEELKHRTLDTYDIPFSAWMVYGYLAGQSTSFHLCRSTRTET